MRWSSVVTVLLCIGSVVPGCNSSTTTPAADPYSATDCPAYNVAGESCTSCVESKCAAQVTAMNSACTSAEFNCGCPANATLVSCGLATACSNAGGAWSSCIETNCASDCVGSSTSNCGEPDAGCAAPDTPATKRPGCCSVAPCTSGTGGLGTCTDTCGNAWFETNGMLYGPCSAGDNACVQSTSQTALANCK